MRALQALVGKPEDADFDCKDWPARQDDARRVIAKAACGFTNATGGVIVIGVKASGAGANTPDVVRSLAPVADRHAVASAALDIILQSVEPGIEGVKIKTIGRFRLCSGRIGIDYGNYRTHPVVVVAALAVEKRETTFVFRLFHSLSRSFAVCSTTAILAERRLFTHYKPRIPNHCGREIQAIGFRPALRASFGWTAAEVKSRLALLHPRHLGNLADGVFSD